MDEVPAIKNFRLTTYFQELSADSLYPSAGSSAAMTAAHAAALFAMACRVNLRKIKGGSSEGKEGSSQKKFWQETLNNAELLLKQALALAQEDGFAIKDFMEGAPRGAERATDIPLKIAHRAGEITALTRRTLSESYAPVQADVECARHLAEGSRKAALTVARYNLPLLRQDQQKSYANRISQLEQEKD